ncbi:MAG: cytochrome c peroxidase [Alphaproteobacteria bacterium]|jgi:mono/diheme cytochrome c family protein|nr:cytochrome c peroxidase [Alphaproteobacteria bacterium]
MRWLDPAGAVASMTEVPRRHLEGGGKQSVLVRLGELAFRAPRILGGEARLAGLSCQTCHPNGDANTRFLVPEVSDRPGNVDVSHRLFNRMTDDGRANPVNIPSLRGVALTAPYGRDGRIASLREFTRNVIVTEFDGAEPAGWLLDALVAYQQQLGFLPGAASAPGGRLTDTASPAAKRGEALFHRPFPKQPSLSCAACHQPSGNFTDGRRHDVGSGGVYVTPSLRNASHTGPYFHDGGRPDFAAVVAHFDRVFGLGLDAAERGDLVAYLKVVGQAERPSVRLRPADELARLADGLSVVDFAAADENAPVGAFAAAALRFELGRMYARFPHDGGAVVRGLLLELSKGLRRLVDLFEAGEFIAARARLRELEGVMGKVGHEVEAAAAGSLYDPTALEAARGG